MDRRTFLQGGLAGLLTYNCSCARAGAPTTLHGCRMAASAGDALGVRLLERPPQHLERYEFGVPGGFTTHLQFNLQFDVHAGMRFYDDGEAPNALAYPVGIVLGFPDGTVLLGVNLLEQRHKGLLEGDEFSPYAIIAHEYGHILQYKKGMSPAGPWQMEPHADFMAGWFLAYVAANEVKFFSKGFVRSEKLLLPKEERVELAMRSFFQIGDYAFNNRIHHGEPDFRAAMVRAGFESGSLRVNEAFEKGRKFAGLT